MNDLLLFCGVALVVLICILLLTLIDMYSERAKLMQIQRMEIICHMQMTDQFKELMLDHGWHLKA